MGTGNSDWVAVKERLHIVEATLAEEIQQSRHDFLTGLPNERMLYQHVEHLGSSCWFVLCDLNDFKAYQDKRQSHAAGDEMLKRFAEFLRDCTRSGEERRIEKRSDRRKGMREPDKIGRRRLPVRLHGDEFVVVTHTREGAEGIAARIREWSYHTVTASAGVGHTMAIADQDMYQQKQAHKARQRKPYCFASMMIVFISLILLYSFISR